MKKKKKRKVNEATIGDLEEIPGEIKTISHTDSSFLDGLQLKPSVNDNDNKENVVGSEDGSSVSSVNNKKPLIQFSETRSAPGSSCVSPVQFDSSSNPSNEGVESNNTFVSNNLSQEEFILHSTLNTRPIDNISNNLNSEHESNSYHNEIQNIGKTKDNIFPDQPAPISTHQIYSNGGAIPKTTIDTFLCDKQNAGDKENKEITQPMNINVNKELHDKLKDIGNEQDE